MEGFIATGLIGISLGSQYTLLALGFTLIFGILGVVNFAHGGFYVMGGYVAYYCTSMLGLSYPVALLIAVGSTAMLGWLFETLILERVIEDHQATLMVTMGFYLVMATAILMIFGAESPEFSFPIAGVWRAGGVYFPYANMVVLGVCLAAIVLVYWLVYRTNLGRAMRAMAEDRAVASALGMRTKVLFPFAFALATGLAGLTGALVTPILALAPHVGEATWKAADTALQTFGGFGYASEYGIERKWRECRIYQTAPISTNLVLAYVGQHVLGLPRSY